MPHPEATPALCASKFAACWTTPRARGPRASHKEAQPAVARRDRSQPSAKHTQVSSHQHEALIPHQHDNRAPQVAQSQRAAARTCPRHCLFARCLQARLQKRPPQQPGSLHPTPHLQHHCNASGAQPLQLTHELTCMCLSPFSSPSKMRTLDSGLQHTMLSSCAARRPLRSESKKSAALFLSNSRCTTTSDVGSFLQRHTAELTHACIPRADTHTTSTSRRRTADGRPRGSPRLAAGAAPRACHALPTAVHDGTAPRLTSRRRPQRSAAAAPSYLPAAPPL